MGDENQSSKKRSAGRELSRDDPGLDDEEDVGEVGTFKKASDEVLASRRIVKVRRQQTSTEASSNPFAGIRLVPPAPVPPPANASVAAPCNAPVDAPANAPAEAQVADDKTAGEVLETEDDASTGHDVKSVELEEKIPDAAAESNADEEKAVPAEKISEANQSDQLVGDNAEKAAESTATDDNNNDVSAENEPAGERQAEEDKTANDDKNENGNTEAGVGAPLSSFQQLSNSQNAFTGLTGSAFSFSSAQKDGSSQLPSFSFGSSNNGSSPLFGATGTGSLIGNKTEGSAFRAMQEVPRETGEENEETAFSNDSALYEFFDGGWKERGKGEVKLNVLKDETRKARLVMRTKGNLRLILNASLYPDMKLTKMDKKGITFACVNIANEGKDSLSTFALKFKDGSIVDEFSLVVSAHKGKPATALKTPENSPKASED